jgi:ATP-dependent phosphofructokinase / diphosphate-dependent phosphofructokinase
VQYALLQGQVGSVAIHRIGDYAVEYALQPLEAVAAKTRVMDDAFINAAGNDVTPAFRDYLRPLLGSDLPQAHRLRGTAVQKVLQRG